MGPVSQAAHDGGRHVLGVIPRSIMRIEVNHSCLWLLCSLCLHGLSLESTPNRVRTVRKLLHNNKNGADYEESDEVHHMPRDENFSNMKAKELVELGTKTLAERVELLLLSLHLKTTPNECNGFQEVQRLYEGGVNLPISITANGTPSVLKFPPPHVIQASLHG